ncbi:MAG: TetR family transcriptional regulator [Paracoccaceae bacterium]
MVASPNRKERHNAEVRARILDGAGRVFRAEGYDRAGIDAVMAEAGLTRGAFYAHFASKEALFVAVLASRHPLLSRLRARQGGARELWQAMQATFAAYLAPEHHDEVSAGCSLAALGRDVSRTGQGAREAYQAAFMAIRAEMARGQAIAEEDPRLTAALTLALGAVSTARALNDPAERDAILRAAAQGFAILTTQALEDPRNGF